MKPSQIPYTEYGKIISAFHQETDRGAAVLAGGLMEDCLAQFLMRHMVQDKAVQSLFEGFGPFASYMQRYEAAYAIGLIPAEMRKDLKLIGNIRNKFAHHPLETNFDSPPISNWCSELSIKKRILEHAPDIKNTNRELYIISIGDICADMTHAIAIKDGSVPPEYVPYVRIK